MSISWTPFSAGKRKWPELAKILQLWIWGVLLERVIAQEAGAWKRQITQLL
jgi:hypothetical protein